MMWEEPPNAPPEPKPHWVELVGLSVVCLSIPVILFVAHIPKPQTLAWDTGPAEYFNILVRESDERQNIYQVDFKTACKALKCTYVFKNNPSKSGRVYLQSCFRPNICSEWVELER